jgi:hypothetical protein
MVKNIFVFEEKQVSLYTDFQRVVDGGITTVMHKPNGSQRLEMKYSSLSR